VLGGFLLVGVIGAVASVVVRFRRSRGVEREQMKWFAYPVVLMLVISPGDYLRGIIGRVASAGVLIAHRSGVHAETTQEHGDIQHPSAGDRCALDLPTR
jgi:hypothetical protein